MLNSKYPLINIIKSLDFLFNPFLEARAETKNQIDHIGAKNKFQINFGKNNSCEYG